MVSGVKVKFYPDIVLGYRSGIYLRDLDEPHIPPFQQFIMNLICSRDGDVPLYLRMADGNETDKTVFAQLMQEFRQQFSLDALMVADSFKRCLSIIT